MKRFLFVLLFFPSVSYALDPVQVTDLNTAAKYVFNAYVRALSVLPSGWSCGVQKTIGIYASGGGGSAYGNFAVTPSCPSKDFGFGSKPYVYQAMQNINCAVAGYCDSVSWTRGSGSLFTTCSAYAQFDRNNNPTVVNTCSQIDPSCMISASGNNSDNYWDQNTTGLKFPYNYYVIYLNYVPGCVVPEQMIQLSTWSASLFGTAATDTAYIRSALVAAKDNSFAMPTGSFGGGFTLTMSGGDSIYSQAISYLDNGVVVSSGVPDLGAVAPSTGTSVSVQGTSVTVNVTVISSPTVVVSSMAFDSLISTAGVDSVYASGQGIISTFTASIQNEVDDMASAVRSAFIPVSSDTWDGCFDLRFKSSAFGGQDMAFGRVVCVSDFGADWVMQLIVVGLRLTAAWIAFGIYMEALS